MKLSEYRPPMTPEDRGYTVETYLAERVEFAPGQTGALGAALYDDYVFWTKARGWVPMTNTAFGRTMSFFGIAKVHSKAGSRYPGLQIRP